MMLWLQTVLSPSTVMVEVVVGHLLVAWRRLEIVVQCAGIVRVHVGHLLGEAEPIDRAGPIRRDC
jgi:hypothetical protein